MRSDTRIRIPTAILVAVMISATGFLVYMDSATAATEDEIENAIALGLAWLADQQGAEGYFGSSGDAPRYKLAQTGLAVLKFEHRAVELGKDPFDENYEYHEQVEKGLDYLFSATSVDEDRVDIIDYTYTTSIAMMAIAASNNPNRTVGALGSAVDGWTFREVLQGMMNWLIYAQQTDLNHPCDEGGWYYYADHDDLIKWTDQSNTGYATLALGYAATAAPYGFGLTVPENVITRLNTFINNIQDPMDNDTWDGGSWYNPCPDPPLKWVNILKTGNLLYEMALVGDNLDTERVQNAISYIENHWNDTGPQPEFSRTSLGWKDSYQAMFTMMKGFEALGIDTITVGGSDIDWFDEVSDVIVANQRGDGYWEYLNTDITEGEQSPVLRAAWAMLTLERVIPLPTPKIEIKKVDEAGALIDMTGATFTISPDPETGTGTLTVVDGDANDANPANGIILIDNVLLNIEFTITETAAPAGHELDPTPQTVTLTFGATVTLEFTNKIKPGSIEIKKVDEENNPLGGSTFKVEPNPYDGAELLVSDGGFNDSDPTDGIILLENVPLDNYTVTENVAPADYEADPNPQIAEVDSSATVTLQFTNKLKPGSLEVTVIVDWDGVAPDNAKTFEICISGPSYPDNDCKTVGYTGGVLTWDNLKPGTYTIAETDPGPEWTVTGEGDVTVVGGATTQATVTNTYATPGSLEVTVIVDWNGVTPDNAKTFEICITGPSYPDNECKTVGYTGGVLTWDNLKPGTYTVTETYPGPEWTVTGEGNVNVVSGAITQATVTDTYVPGSLEVTVVVDWNGVTPDTTKTFEICITGPSYPDNDCKTVGYTGGVLTWDNLKPGTYTVTENYPGPEWTVTGEGNVNVVSGATTQTTVTNTYVPGGLEVTVVVDWNGVTPDTTKTFEICISGPSYPDNDYKTVGYNGGGLTWDNLKPGTYSVTETDPGPKWTVTGEGNVNVVSGATTQTTITNNTYAVPGSLEVTVIVDWGGATPDITKTFEICITGPSYPDNDCKSVGYNGGVLTWDNLEPGTYTITETDPGPEWTVTGEGDVTVVGGATTQATITNTHMTMTDNFRKEFTEPMVWTEAGWVSLDDWHIGNGTPGQEWVPTFRKIKWTVTYYVPNTSGDTMYDAVLKDRFGAELDQANPGQYTASQGSVTFEYSTGEMEQLRITWDIGDLPDGTTATLSFDVVTKQNPAGKQEYTSPGRKTLNSGAVLKWKDASGHQHSMSTPPCYVMARDGECDTITTIKITPKTLNLASKGKWITCHIELPCGYSVENIDASTIVLIYENENVPAEPSPTTIVDQDNKVKLMVKFSRPAVQAIVSVGEVELTVIGKVAGVPFEGSDTIRVIDFGHSALKNARLGVSLNLDSGHGLAIRFYTYEGDYQGENVVWSGPTPAHVVLLEDIPHPENEPVENATLVLTDDADNVISTIASFVVLKGNLMTRLSMIKHRWPYTLPAGRSALIGEISSIKEQWSYAPAILPNV